MKKTDLTVTSTVLQETKLANKIRVVTHDGKRLSMYAGSSCIVHEIPSVRSAMVLKGWKINSKVGNHPRLAAWVFPAAAP